MSTQNRFIGGNGSCFSEIFLPALCDDYIDTAAPKKSQISALIILPDGAPGPANWVSKSDVEAIVDNSVTDNTAAKYLIGRGEQPEAEDIIVSLGKTDKRLGGRIFRIRFEVNTALDSTYAFVRQFQKKYRAFKFWFVTKGGRLVGGSTGIRPRFVTAHLPYGGGNADREKGIINIEWVGDGDASRTYMPGLFDDAPASSSSSNVMFYHQGYASQTSSTLTWTTNSGVLPTSNTQAQILVFQEGQKLEETVQYTITHLTGPAESEISIDASVHYSGANYEVIAIITS